MTPPRVLVGVLVRSVVIALVIAAYSAILDRSDSTDALGAGLLAFLLLVGLAFVGALVDGVRHGPGTALLLWVSTAVLGSIGICVVLSIREAGGSIGSELDDGLVFFAVLLLVPALAGLGLGALVHRVSGGRPDERIL